MLRAKFEVVMINGILIAPARIGIPAGGSAREPREKYGESLSIYVVIDTSLLIYGGPRITQLIDRKRLERREREKFRRREPRMRS